MRNDFFQLNWLKINNHCQSRTFWVLKAKPMKQAITCTTNESLRTCFIFKWVFFFSLPFLFHSRIREEEWVCLSQNYSSRMREWFDQVSLGFLFFAMSRGVCPFCEESLLNNWINRMCTRTVSKQFLFRLKNVFEADNKHISFVTYNKYLSLLTSCFMFSF